MTIRAWDESGESPDALPAVSDARSGDPSRRSPADATFAGSARAAGHIQPATINPGEAFAAQTALTALTEALIRLGLQVRVYRTMLLASHSAASGADETGLGPVVHQVVLAHNPADRYRLWWWLPVPEPGNSSPALWPCGRATDVRATADRVARLIAEQTADHDTKSSTAHGRVARPETDAAPAAAPARVVVQPGLGGSRHVFSDELSRPG